MTAKVINDKVLRFAKSRENAYRYSPTPVPDVSRKLQAIMQIKYIMASAVTYDVAGTARCVLEIKDSIYCILPSPMSRYSHSREEILSLISECSRILAKPTDGAHNTTGHRQTQLSLKYNEPTNKNLSR